MKSVSWLIMHFMANRKKNIEGYFDLSFPVRYFCKLGRNDPIYKNITGINKIL